MDWLNRPLQDQSTFSQRPLSVSCVPLHKEEHTETILSVVQYSAWGSVMIALMSYIAVGHSITFHVYTIHDQQGVGRWHWRTAGSLSLYRGCTVMCTDEPWYLSTIVLSSSHCFFLVCTRALFVATCVCCWMIFTCKLLSWPNPFMVDFVAWCFSKHTRPQSQCHKKKLVTHLDDTWQEPTWLKTLVIHILAQ